MRRVVLAASLFASVLVGPRAPASAADADGSLTAGFQLVSYPTGQAPYNLTNYFWLANGGLLTSGRDGTITHVAPDGTPHEIAQVPNVRVVGDHAMLGFSPANDYATTGTVYLAYENGDPLGTGYGMVEEWTATPPSDPTSFVYARTVIDGSATSPPLLEEGMTHGLDSVVVAPDGTLFVTIGDNSKNNGDPATLRAQDLDQPYGKLLHITATGAGVETNPFYTADAPSSWRSRVYAYGFRNPFRLAVDPRNGRVYVGDVGWFRAEEVDIVRPGDNAGWPCYEGTIQPAFVSGDPVCQALYAAGSALQPLITYGHRAGAAAVVAGMFYRGESYPRAYRRAFFYGDYVRGTVWTLRTNRAGELIRPPERPPFASGTLTPVVFQPGPNDDVTFANISAGTVERLMTAIDVKFAALPHPWKRLGRPTGAEYAVAGGQARPYLRGRIYWSVATGAHVVRGPILAKYLARGGPHSCLGFPISDGKQVPGGVRSRFASGMIRYWRADGRISVSCGSVTP